MSISPNVLASDEAQKEALLKKAEAYLAEGQLYQAAKVTRKAIQLFPKDSDAIQLLAVIEVAEDEIYEQMQLRDSVLDAQQMNLKQKLDMAQTWVERSRELYEMKKYREATLAAEEAFKYDPQNVNASRMLDTIQAERIKEGQTESDQLRRIYRDEISEKIERYHEQLDEYMAGERWGMARFTAQKILLLAPEDPRALKKYEEINTRLQAAKQL
ncbi:MAG: tetratricopeptide repeat protein [Candidatus Omnitrophica bacterium]|nr:tetratricopeptide repeat protein [Candidatus Omnitrophota bacterium]